MSVSAAVARLDGVTRTYRQDGVAVDALRGANLEIRKGDFAVLVGPSGSGKTTLLNMIGALDSPTEGRIWIAGSEIGRLSKAELSQLRLRKIGFVFQEFNLIPVLSALENVEFVMLLQGRSESQRRARASALLKELGLEGLEHRRPNALSGGQQQRVAVARLSALYAPRPATGDSSAALRWHANHAGIDYSFVAGRFGSDRVAGGDIATQLGDAGLRAELTGAQRQDGSSYRRALVALDYAFRNTLTLSGELYYDGSGAPSRDSYDFTSLFAGAIRNVGRRYLGAYAGYEITPLLKSANYLVVNLADGSGYFSPSFTYSLMANLDLSMGVQLFRGGADSEYGRFSDASYAQVQWFF